MPYIVCHKKRNNPRMDLRICEMKCAEKNHCKEYVALQKVKFPEKETNLPAGTYSWNFDHKLSQE